MSSAITIGDPVRVAVPTALSGNRVGEVVEIAKFVNTTGDIRCRYLLKFTGSQVPLWYFDYEVESEGDQESFSVGDLVQCPGFKMIYEIVKVDPVAGMLDVRAVSTHGTLFKNFPMYMFKRYTAPAEAKCSACGQMVEHNAQ